VLYEMLVGELPYTGATAQAMMARRLSGEIPRMRAVRPNVSESLEHAVTKALAMVPADRFVSAAEFARALAASEVLHPSITRIVVQAPAQESLVPPPPDRRAPAALLSGLGERALSGLGRVFGKRGYKESVVTGAAAGPKRLAVLPLTIWVMPQMPILPMASPTPCEGSSRRCPGCWSPPGGVRASTAWRATVLSRSERSWASSTC
jgi:hypothetical protein